MIEAPVVQLGAVAVLAANGGGAGLGSDAGFDGNPALGGGNLANNNNHYSGNGCAGDITSGGTGNIGNGAYGGGGVTSGAVLSPSHNTAACTFGNL